MKPKDLKDKYMVRKGLDEGTYVCKLCYKYWNSETTEKVKTIKAGRGYSWDKQHIEAKHKEVLESDRTKQTTIVSDVTKDTWCWIEWIVSENREISFCEKERVRKYTDEI